VIGIDVISAEERNGYTNVVETTVEEALLTGGIVLIQTSIGPFKVRIHVGGNRRFELLGQEGKKILCHLGTINLIPRTDHDLPVHVVDQIRP
jgi:hypothetical protein